MKKTLQFFKLVFTTLCIFIVTNSISAQIRVPGGTSGILPQTDGQTNILIGRTTDLHDNNADAFHQLGVDANTVGYGSRTAMYGISRSNAITGTSRGAGKGFLGSSSDWNKNGSVVGAGGIADSVYILDNPNPAWNGHSAALGGSFGARIFNPIPAGSATSGIYTIAGVRGTLLGNISTYPTQGVVAAMYGNDEIQGSGTWAGYFAGRGYFSHNVGVNTLNPLSTLSVNGDGDNRVSIYAHTTSTIAGNSAIRGEADQPTGFADHVRAIVGTIEAGGGYTYGVSGTAFSSDGPSSAGRAYGVFADAGDATPGANFGLYARLRGSHAPPSSANNYKLFVCGGIIGQELFINNSSWCDYVFEDDYELLPLEKVEEHIKEKGHLHNTPSADQIEKQDGFEMGEMTRNQQEKIEEIYLHLIDMQKRIVELEKENASLRQATEKK